MPVELPIPQYHSLAHQAANYFGYSYDETAPDWVHPTLHLVLVLAPVLLVSSFAFLTVRGLYFRVKQVRATKDDQLRYRVAGLRVNLISQILLNTRQRQICLLVISLSLMPLLYLSLELPKQIVNNVLGSTQTQIDFAGYQLTQFQLLAVLSGVYFFTIAINGIGKYHLNVQKSRVSERCLRQMRLLIYRDWRTQRSYPRKCEIPQVLGQEIEPIGGLAADLVALPVTQGGTLFTILLFMFVQDPILGISALTVLPFQLILLPYLQRLVNRLSRQRIQEMRHFSRCLADQFDPARDHRSNVRKTASSIRQLEKIRWRIHRLKFFTKALNNFLMSLTPFLFYSLGGYFVIQERITLGALIAVLAAHKDFSAPLKELFRFYQQFEDTRIRYKEIFKFLNEPRPNAQ